MSLLVTLTQPGSQSFVLSNGQTINLAFGPTVDLQELASIDVIRSSPSIRSAVFTGQMNVSDGTQILSGEAAYNQLLGITLDDSPRDLNGNRQTSEIYGFEGRQFNYRMAQFTTSKTEVHNCDRLGRDRGDFAVSLWKVDGKDAENKDILVPAIPSEATRTKALLSPDYKFDIVSGTFWSVANITNDVYAYVIGAPQAEVARLALGGLPESVLPGPFERLSNANLKFIRNGDFLNVDGRNTTTVGPNDGLGPFRLLYTQLEFLIQHDPGQEIEFQIGIEHYV